MKLKDDWLETTQDRENAVNQVALKSEKENDDVQKEVQEGRHGHH